MSRGQGGVCLFAGSCHARLARLQEGLALTRRNKRPEASALRGEVEWASATIIDTCRAIQGSCIVGEAGAARGRELPI